MTIGILSSTLFTVVVVLDSFKSTEGFCYDLNLIILAARLDLYKLTTTVSILVIILDLDIYSAGNSLSYRLFLICMRSSIDLDVTRLSTNILSNATNECNMSDVRCNARLALFNRTASYSKLVWTLRMVIKGSGKSLSNKLFLICNRTFDELDVLRSN